MARTFRKYATWVNWLNNFEDTLHRGLTSVPKIEILRNGKRGIDEIWTEESKRFRKQRISRTRRRKDKQLCQRYHRI